jgi:endogenous inhibitor of DNA gyrase (YacG/DUF329 family)
MTDKSQNAGSDGDIAPLCVICGIRPQTGKYRPFCSKRCADVDLHRWLDGVYAIPSKPEEEEDETPGER